MSVNTEKKQKNNRFKPGQSGNPRGKPKGSRNKATLAAEALLEGEVENICRRLVLEAQEGNMQAIKLVLDRILPPKKSSLIQIDLPKLENSADALHAISAITLSVAKGEITPAEGEILSKIIDVHVKALEAYEFEKRLSSLENKTS